MNSSPNGNAGSGPGNVGRYHVLDRLSDGPLGPLYRVLDPDSHDVLCLRVVRRELTVSPLGAGRARDVLRLWREVRHPHVVTLTDAGELDGLLYTVTPLAARGNLHGVLGDGEGRAAPLALDQAAAFGAQIASGLGALHAAGLLHGRLSPHNVLLDAPRPAVPAMAVLTDFGLGGLLPSEQALWAGAAYASPEVCRGAPATPRSDTYGLGVLLFEILTGLVPFEARSAAEAAVKHQHVAPRRPREFRPDLPDDLERLILACLAKHPEDRPATQEVMASLERLRGTLGPRVPHPTLAAPAVHAAEPRLQVPGGTSDQHRLQVSDVAGQVLRVVEIGPEGLTVGRLPGNTLQLEHDSVSRHHLRVDVRGGDVTVTDLSSTNGTYLRGAPLPAVAPQRWVPGEALQVTSFWLTLHAPTRPADSEPVRAHALRADLTLTPGERTDLELHITNRGSRVEHYRLELEGAPATWWEPPRELQLNPGENGVISVPVRAPRDPRAHAGQRDVTITVRSREHPAHVAHVRGTWTVLPYEHAILAVRLARAWAWRTVTAHVTVHNAGNTPAALDLRVDTPGVPLRLTGLPDGVRLQPDEQVTYPVRARAPLRLLGRTRDVQLNFRLLSGQHAQAQSEVAARQRPLLPRWAPPALLGAAALAAALLVRPPDVRGLALNPTLPEVQQPVTVRWTAARATSVEIAPYGVNVDASDGTYTFEDGFLAPTRVTVIARNRFGRTERTVEISPRARALPAPVIEQFEVTPLKVAPGEPVTIRWRTTNAQNITLDPIGTVPASGSYTDYPTAGRAYRLAATSGSARAERSAELRVEHPAPQIQAFTARRDGAGSGVLEWRTEHATRVVLSAVGDVPAQGRHAMALTDGPSTFTLVARGSDGREVTRSVTVQGPEALTPSAADGAPAPELSFTVQPDQVEAGGVATLRWNVPGADRAELQGVGEVPARGERQVTAAADRHFTLTFDRGGSRDTRRVTLKVKSATAPRIESFTVSPNPAPRGGNVTVRWEVQGANKVFVGPFGATAHAGTATLAVNGPTDVRLTALGDAGQTQRTVRVETTTPAAAPPEPAAPPPVKVVQFAASDARITSGETVTLRWDVEHADRVELEGHGTVAAHDTLQVTPTASRTYRLHARQGDRSITRSVLVRVNTVAERTTAGGPVGLWWHSFGTLDLTRDGSRFEGTLQDRDSNQTSLVKGRLYGETLSGTISTVDGEKAFTLTFDAQARTFTGVFVGRTGRWCGWRPGGEPPACGRTVAP